MEEFNDENFQLLLELKDKISDIKNLLQTYEKLLTIAFVLICVTCATSFGLLIVSQLK